jgi:hypothetical protein
MKNRCWLILSVSAILPAAKAATITAIAPSCAAVGAQVTMIGTGFDAGGLTITVGGVPAAVGTVTSSTASFTVPAGVSLGPTTVAAVNTGSTGNVAFTVCDLLMPASWGGQWQITMTYRDAASGNLVETDQITNYIRSGEPFGLTGATNLGNPGDCTGSVSGTHLSILCGGQGVLYTCVLANSVQISADLTGDAITGSGSEAVTLSGTCGGFHSFTKNIQITGKRISQDQNPNGPPLTLLSTFWQFSAIVGGGPAANIASQIAVTSTGFLFSRVTRLYSGTLMAKNTGTQAIGGPAQIVLTNLTPGVTLANATGMTNGSPYITVPDSIGLAAGQAASVNVEFYNPSNALINFTPVTYSGSF